MMVKALKGKTGMKDYHHSLYGDEARVQVQETVNNFASS